MKLNKSFLLNYGKIESVLRIYLKKKVLTDTDGIPP